MSLVSLLATTTTIIALTNLMPEIYAANQRPRIPLDYDHLLLVLLLNHRNLGDQTKLFESTEEEFDKSGYGRDKRIGSLSIVNSVDVLRDRVLLELARREAMKVERQISENREILNKVGKRSGDVVQSERLYGKHWGNSRKKRMGLQRENHAEVTQDIGRVHRLERLLMIP